MDDLATNLDIDVQDCRQGLLASKDKQGSPRFQLQQLADGKTYVWLAAKTSSPSASPAEDAGAAPSAPAPVLETAAKAEQDEREVPPKEEEDRFSDLPDFSPEMHNEEEAVEATPALPHTESGLGAAAKAAPVAAAKAPTQAVG